MWVVDKKIVRHLIQRRGGLLELPVRVKYEYCVEDGVFRAGSLQRDVLYNADAVIKHIPELSKERLAADVLASVDRALEEELRFAGYLAGDTPLFAAPAGNDAEPAPRPPPKLILP